VAKVPKTRLPSSNLNANGLLACALRGGGNGTRTGIVAGFDDIDGIDDIDADDMDAGTNGCDRGPSG